MRLLCLLGLMLVITAAPYAWPLPPPLETRHLLGVGLASGVPPVSLTDEFYALGWSRSNAFASLERRSLGAGNREVRFRVVDLVEDRTLVEETWDDWGEGDQATWWALHETAVDGVFAKFGLEPTTWQLGVFPLILDNEFYTLALRSEKSSRNPEWIDQLEVVVHSTGRGLKTVEELDGYWRWASLLGFLASPFENRVALVLLVQPSGWAGKDQPLRFVVTGLSLKAGFPTP